MAPDARVVIEARLDGDGLVARLTAAIRGKIADRKPKGKPVSPAHWRRAESLWPDFAPRIKD